MMDITLKAYFEASFLKMVREGLGDGGEDGEGKFGFVPPSLDPNSLLSRPASRVGQGNPARERIKSHPLLSKTQQFSGIDPKLTANPVENTAAQENYPQLRMQNQLRLNQRKRKMPPTLTPR
jgi:hypothetical protein